MYRGNLGKGVVLAALLVLGGVPVTLVLLPIVGESLLPILFGSVCLLFLVPTILHYRNAGETETVKGFVIVGGLFILLNSYCWGLALTGKFRP
jgi:hypothetical protein